MRKTDNIEFFSRDWVWSIITELYQGRGFHNVEPYTFQTRLNQDTNELSQWDSGGNQVFIGFLTVGKAAASVGIGVNGTTIDIDPANLNSNHYVVFDSLAVVDDGAGNVPYQMVGWRATVDGSNFTSPGNPAQVVATAPIGFVVGAFCAQGACSQNGAINETYADDAGVPNQVLIPYSFNAAINNNQFRWVFKRSGGNPDRIITAFAVPPGDASWRLSSIALLPLDQTNLDTILVQYLAANETWTDLCTIGNGGQALMKDLSAGFAKVTGAGSSAPDNYSWEMSSNLASFTGFQCGGSMASAAVVFGDVFTWYVTNWSVSPKNELAQVTPGGSGAAAWGAALANRAAGYSGGGSLAGYKIFGGQAVDMDNGQGQTTSLEVLIQETIGEGAPLYPAMFITNGI